MANNERFNPLNQVFNLNTTIDNDLSAIELQINFRNSR